MGAEKLGVYGGAAVLRRADHQGIYGSGQGAGADFDDLWVAHDTLDSSGAVTDSESEFNSIDHPEWFTNRKIDSGMGNSADLGNEECVAYLQDLLTATLATVINCDDVANYLSMRTPFYDSSYVIHPAQLQMPCNMDFCNPETEGIYWPEVSTTYAAEDYDFTDTMIDMGMRSQCLGVPASRPGRGMS